MRHRFYLSVWRVPFRSEKSLQSASHKTPNSRFQRSVSPSERSIVNETAGRQSLSAGNDPPSSEARRAREENVKRRLNRYPRKRRRSQLEGRARHSSWSVALSKPLAN